MCLGVVDIYIDRFQSTHPHGVRLVRSGQRDESKGFQSTHPHGVRRRIQKQYFDRRWVSIHAPTRGATPTNVVRQDGLIVSIHAPTRGATTRHRSQPPCLDRFQSTHPHGVRLNWQMESDRYGGFNPRTHTGCDRAALHTISTIGGFNPRTHTGCDNDKSEIVNFMFSFNPRTHTGCDAILSTLCKAVSVSIHAPTRGATKSHCPALYNSRFQSTHPHGVRQCAKLHIISQ